MAAAARAQCVRVGRTTSTPLLRARCQPHAPPARRVRCRCDPGVAAPADPARLEQQQQQQPVDLDAEFDKQLRQIFDQMDPDKLLDDYDILLGDDEGSAPGGTAPAGATATTTRPAAAAAAAAAASGASPPGNRSPHHVDQPTMEAGLPEGFHMTPQEYQKRAALLVGLLTAEPAAFDQQLAVVKQHLDEALLAMVDKRLQLAAQHQQGDPVVQQLQQLQSLLRLEWQRSQASPALRLLDDVLELLGDDRDAPDYPQRQQDAANRLRDAFTGGGIVNMDVFAVAEALAEAGPLAAEALQVEAVSPVAFLQETAALQAESEAAAQELQRSVAMAQSEIQMVRNCNPQLLQTQASVQHIQRVQQAEEALLLRKAALAQLEDVLQIAAGLQLSEGQVTL